MGKKVAILLLIFNRPDSALQAFKPIEVYKPDKLYIAADGPRKEKQNEFYKCNDTRNAVLNKINWDCEIHTLFRNENLGCAQAVSSAISWFFEHEKYGVIIEDDIVLSQDFFYLCEILLPMYESEERIMQITAQNRSMKYQISDEYSFSRMPIIWGWATWKRAWNKMDMSMKTWPKFNKLKIIHAYGMFQGCMMWYYWHITYKHIFTNQSWATRWFYCVLYNDGMCISPKVNLAINLGIGSEDATHYKKGDINPYAALKLGTIRKPLHIASEIVYDKEQLRSDREDFFRIRMIGLRKRIKALFH